MALISLVATRLRTLRLRHHLTQEQAAEMLGVTTRFYQVIESGRKKQIWLDTVARMAAPYGLEAWQLIGPELPADTHLTFAVAESSIHYKPRRGPYGKSS